MNTDRDPLRAFNIRTGIRQTTGGREPTSHRVAAAILELFQTAKSHRDSIGITERMEREMRQHNGVHEAADARQIQDTGVDIYVPVSTTKYSQGKALILRVLGNLPDAPLVAEPSDLPDIPESKRQDLRQRLLQRLQEQNIPLDPSDFGPALQQAAAVKEEMRQIIQDECKIAGDGMSRRLNDRARQGGLFELQEEIIGNMLMFPTAFVLRDHKVSRPKIKWDNDKVVVVEEDGDYYIAPHPYDIYPMPDCTNTQNGTGIHYVSWMTTSELSLLENNPDFQHIPAVMKAIKEGSCKVDWLNQVHTDTDERYRMQGRRMTESGEKLLSGKRYPVLRYYGQADKQQLQEAGVTLSAMPDGVYECEMWVIGKFVIYSRLNPYPKKTRPLYSVSYDTVSGTFWHQSMYDRVWEAQRQANAIVRELYAHIPTIVQPVVEASIERWGLTTRPARYQPGMIIYTHDEPNNGGRAAIRLHNASSHVQELMALFNQTLAQADEDSLLSRLAYGGASQSSDRSIGQISLKLQGQNNFFDIEVRRLVKSIYSEPGNHLYDDEMLFGKDSTIKCDAKISIAGVDGIIKKEQAEQNVVQDLQLITPYIPLLGQQGPLLAVFLLRQFLSARGYTDTDINLRIPDPVEAQQILSGLQAAGAGPSTQTVPPAGPQQGSLPSVPLDGRQASAQLVN